MVYLKLRNTIHPKSGVTSPLQDFTSSSDVDWSKSIHEIDLQLYHKYGLDDAEIDFIETAAERIAARRRALPADFDERQELLGYLDEKYGA